MTDLERFKALFDLVDCKYREQDVDEDSDLWNLSDSDPYRCIFFQAADKNVEGYISFYTILKFDNAGKFLKMGIYE